jgi:hypothetical protein
VKVVFESVELRSQSPKLFIFAISRVQFLRYHSILNLLSRDFEVLIINDYFSVDFSVFVLFNSLSLEQNQFQSQILFISRSSACPVSSLRHHSFRQLHFVDDFGSFDSQSCLGFRLDGLCSAILFISVFP